MGKFVEVNVDFSRVKNPDFSHNNGEIVDVNAEFSS